MFLDYYRLREQPFGVTPDPRFLYFSPAHREALASLFYGIDAGRGFLALIAEPGMGKTTLLFQLLKRLKGSVLSAFLFQTQCDSHELLRYLLEALGLESRGQDLVQMHAQLNEFLYREAVAGRRVAVFIDEAQNLSDTVLETVRLLSDFEAADKKLLQIVLAGQPALAQRLARPSLVQLRQRIAVQAQLDPLPLGETVRYVQHRLKVAGYQGPELFTRDAMELIAERSRGIPRLINNLCFNALSLACAMRLWQIESGVAKEAAEDLSTGLHVSGPAAPQREAAHPTARNPRSSRKSLYSHLREKFLGRRHLLQTTIFLVAIGSLGIFLGTRIRPATAQPSAVLPVYRASSVLARGLEPRSEQQARSVSSGVLSPKSR